MLRSWLTFLHNSWWAIRSGPFHSRSGSILQVNKLSNLNALSLTNCLQQFKDCQDGHLDIWTEYFCSYYLILTFHFIKFVFFLILYLLSHSYERSSSQSLSSCWVSKTRSQENLYSKMLQNAFRLHFYELHR